MTAPDWKRAAIVEAMALAIARHRMSDTARLLAPADLVTMSDRRLAYELIHMAAPLYPLPDPTPRDLPEEGDI